MTQPRILIAGIGNIFFGDDAFGVEIARRLMQRPLPADVRVVDFGIRGIDLVYALMDGYEATILVDATSRGGTAGTIYVIEPDLSEIGQSDRSESLVEPHSMNPMKVLNTVKAMGGQFNRILLVGCEPHSLDMETGRMGLSEPVAAALDEAIATIEALIEKILNSPIM